MTSERVTNAWKIERALVGNDFGGQFSGAHHVSPGNRKRFAFVLTVTVASYRSNRDDFGYQPCNPGCGDSCVPTLAPRQWTCCGAKLVHKLVHILDFLALSQKQKNFTRKKEAGCTKQPKEPRSPAMCPRTLAPENSRPPTTQRQTIGGPNHARPSYLPGRHRVGPTFGPNRWRSNR